MNLNYDVMMPERAGGARKSKYRDLVSEFLKSGEPIAQITPDEGKSVRSINGALRAACRGYDMPIAISLRQGALYLIREDEENGQDDI